MKTDLQLLFESQKKIRKQLKLPYSISIMLSSFEKSIDCYDGSSSSNNQYFQANSQMQAVFAKFTKLEKMQHYSLCVNFLNLMTGDGITNFKKKTFDKAMIHTFGYRKTGILGFSQKTMVIIDNLNKKLILGGSGKKQQKINLKNYFMRQSKDPSKFCIIFDCIVKYEFKQEIRLFFQQHVFLEVRSILRLLMNELQKEKLYDQLIRNTKSSKLVVPETSHTLSTPQNLYILNYENVKVFRSLFQTLKQNQDESTETNRLQIFTSSYKTISTNGNVYYLQELFFLSKQDVIMALSSKDHKWNSLCQDSIIVETSDTEIVVCQKYLQNDIKYSCTFIMSNNKGSNNDRFMLKSIYSSGIGNQQPLHIQFVYIKVLKITNQTSQLYVKARMETRDSNREAFIIDYLKQFSNVYQTANILKQKIKNTQETKNIQQLQEETLYFDVCGSQDLQLTQFNANQKDISSSFASNMEIDIPSTSTDLTSSMNYQENIIILPKQYQCLQKKLQVIAEKVPLIIQKQHYLKKQWIRNKNGGLLCINERILTQQKKVLKHVFTSIGRNLFSTKGIMNISLPASVCTKSSHLKLIAGNFGYGPILVEPSCSLSPLDRIKKLIVFLITIGNTGIASEKPFNPILGQTFQGTINGCPIYLEQISHHPPISSYIFEGRGYKVMGAIEPKVQPTGINSVRCYSQKQNKICFDDGSTVYLSFPKIILKGLLYGNRQFCFEGKNFVYDQKNNIYAEVNYGPRKQSFLGFRQKDPIDLVHGKIYSVNPSFKGLFIQSKKSHSSISIKQHISCELGQFQGTWTQSIKFDGIQFFDFQTELPCVLQQQGKPLPSDSQFRSDIIRLCQQNLKQAQSQKQRLEDLQRRDKTLREKHKNSKTK